MRSFSRVMRQCLLGAMLIAVPDVRFAYFEPSDPVIVADPGATGEVPKSKTGVRVVPAPVWIIDESAARLVA